MARTDPRLRGPVEGMKGFPRAAAERLLALNVSSREELIDILSTSPGLKTSVLRAARVGERALLRALGLEEFPRPVLAAPLGRMGLGCLPPGEGGGPTVRRASSGASLGPPPRSLPGRVDLRHLVGPVRDQGGSRGTCCAFAGCAVAESLTGRGGVTDTSEEFHYWDIKKHDGIRGEGSHVKWSLARLESGVCAEKHWPYDPEFDPTNITHAPPPRAAVRHVRDFRTVGAFSVNPRDVEVIKRVLADGRLVAFGMPMYPSTTRSFTFHRTGKIFMPFPGEETDVGHAVVLIGYDDDPTIVGGGAFQARTAWGRGFARENPVAPNHIQVPYGFVRRYAWEAGFATALASGSASRSRRGRAKGRRRSAARGRALALLSRLAVVGRAAAGRVGRAVDEASWSTVVAAAIAAASLSVLLL